MAHDQNGNQLQVGDAVVILAYVKAIDGDEERGSNITLETAEPAFPHNNTSSFSLNSRQVAAVDISDEEMAEEGTQEPQEAAGEVAAPLDAAAPEETPAAVELPEQSEDAPTDPGTPEAAEEHP